MYISRARLDDFEAIFKLVIIINIYNIVVKPANAGHIGKQRV
jgi:hypothetical protein